MTLTVTYAGLTDKGRVRDQNQDRWAADPANGIFLVSDGIGGGFAGDLASKIVAEVLPGALRDKLAGQADLRDPGAAKEVCAAISEVSSEMRAKAKKEPGFDGMGATVVLAVVQGEHAIIAHMGDSRAYLWRRHELTLLTKDHSITQLLIDSGDITPEEAKTHPSRGRLSRCVGMDGEPKNGNKPLDALAKNKYLVLKAMEVGIGHVKRDDVGASRSEPAASGGTWNTSARCV